MKERMNYEEHEGHEGNVDRESTKDAKDAKGVVQSFFVSFVVQSFHQSIP